MVAGKPKEKTTTVGTIAAGVASVAAATGAGAAVTNWRSGAKQADELLTAIKTKTSELLSPEQVTEQFKTHAEVLVENATSKAGDVAKALQDMVMKGLPAAQDDLSNAIKDAVKKSGILKDADLSGDALDAVKNLVSKADNEKTTIIATAEAAKATIVKPGISGKIGDLGEKFGGLGPVGKAGVVLGSLAALVVTYSAVKGLMPKEKTQQGTNQYQGTVEQRSPQMAASH